MPEILQSKRNIFPVVGEEQQFKGLVYVEELLKKSFNSQTAMPDTVEQLMELAPAVIDVNAELKEVLQLMEKENVWILPVVDEDDTYIGFVSKTAIFNKYRAMLSRQADYMN